MEGFDSDFIQTVIIMGIVFGTGIVILLGVSWLDYRAKIKAIEVLKIYAEKGQEPPADILETVSRVGGGGNARALPLRPPTRGDHLSDFAGGSVLAIGAAGIAWWSAPETGDPGFLMIVAVIVAVFFAGFAAARLVAALHTRDAQ